MSKIIYIASIILVVLIFLGIFGYTRILEETAAEKGELLLNEILSEDFELIGKSNSEFNDFGSFFSSTYSNDNYNSYKFVDTNGVEYYTDFVDGSLIKYKDQRYSKNPIEDETLAGASAVFLAKKYFSNFFNYDYEYKANPYFGDYTIIISQLNSEGIFTGNYIEVIMNDDINVCEMDITDSYNPEEEVLNKEEVMDIAYHRAIYTLDCVREKLSGKNLSYFQQRVYSQSVDEDLNNVFSQMIKKSSGNLSDYNTNILNRDELEFSAYTKIAYRDEYWWKVYIDNINGNIDMLYSNKNTSYLFTCVIDPRTGEILFADLNLE